MRKRVLSFLLAASAAFCFICSSAPEAQAIVPIGFVQSALASYVSSTGYKLYNDNGTGQDILGSLGELYDDYVTIADKTITGQLANLAFLANSPYIYQDNSGQIVVSKVAADIFQDFADWIQTEYSVPVGSDTATEVVAPTGGTLSNAAGTVTASHLSFDNSITYSGSTYYLTSSLGTFEVIRNNVSEGFFPLFFGAQITGSFYATLYQPASTLTYVYTCGIPSRTPVTFFYLRDGNYVLAGGSNASSQSNSFGMLGSFSDRYQLSLPVSSVDPSGVLLTDLTVSSGGVAGLAVTLAQAVADVVGQAKDDDAVVIGVGASAGATAQDIADMVAQGVKAQTLDPSVSITAEAVIDTPVQPYPDIDGLGLPTLGAALVDRFPFCIPWDFVDTVKLLSADPQPINIKVDLIPQRIKTSVGITSDTSFDIDLSGEQYAKIGVFCRWGSLITFCFGLFLLTKRLVWTA